MCHKRTVSSNTGTFDGYGVNLKRHWHLRAPPVRKSELDRTLQGLRLGADHVSSDLRIRLGIEHKSRTRKNNVNSQRNCQGSKCLVSISLP